METLKLVQMSDDNEEIEVEEEPTGILVEPKGESEVEEEPTESIKTSSLSSMVIKEVMEWDPRIGDPEPHLMDKVKRCEEEDLSLIHI